MLQKPQNNPKAAASQSRELPWNMWEEDTVISLTVLFFFSTTCLYYLDTNKVVFFFHCAIGGLWDLSSLTRD